MSEIKLEGTTLVLTPVKSDVAPLEVYPSVDPRICVAGAFVLKSYLNEYDGEVVVADYVKSENTQLYKSISGRFFLEVSGGTAIFHHMYGSNGEETTQEIPVGFYEVLGFESDRLTNI